MRFKILLFQLFMSIVGFSYESPKTPMIINSQLSSSEEVETLDPTKTIIVLGEIAKLLSLEESELSHFDFYNEAYIKLAKELGDYSSLARAYMYKSIFYNSLNNSLSQEYYQKALDVLQHYFDNALEKSWFYIEIAKLYETKALYDKAIYYLDKCFEILEPINSERLSFIYYDYAQLLYKTKKYEDALKYLKKVINDFRVTKRLKFLAQVSVLNIKYHLGAYDEVIKEFNSCIVKESQIFETEPLMLFSSKIFIGLSYQKLHKYQQAYEIVETIDKKDIEYLGYEALEGLDNLITLYRSIEKYDRAFEYTAIKEHLKYEYKTKEREKELEKLNLLYETKVSELEIEKQKTEELVINQKAKQSEVTLFFLLNLSLLIISIVLIRFWYVSSTKRKTKIIKAQKEEIELTYNEYLTLTKELNHRVKNNLQIISSFIFLSYSEVKDQNFVNILKSINSRIQSIALLHQELSIENQSNRVNMSQYFQKVSKTVNEIYEVKHKKVNLSVDVPQVEIRINDAVTLGVLINELISNSYKYAFSKTNIQEKITIKVTHVSDNYYQLIYNDGGTFGREDDKKTSPGLGSSLILLFAEKVGGTIDYIDDKTSKNFVLTFMVN